MYGRGRGGGGSRRGGGGGFGKRNYEGDYNNDDGYHQERFGGGTSNTDLISLIRSLDRRQYPAYKALYRSNEGSPPLAWQLTRDGINWSITFHHIQGDPYAPPSVVEFCTAANFPDAWKLFSPECRSVALCDYLQRLVAVHVESVAKHTRSDDSYGGGGEQPGARGGWSSSKGGNLECCTPGQNILRRTGLVFQDGGKRVALRIRVSLPARGRTIQGDRCEQVLLGALKAAELLDFRKWNKNQVAAACKHMDICEDQNTLRNMVVEAGLVSFVPNGALLPRLSGVSDLPLRTAAQNARDSAVTPFVSPPELTVSFTLPHRGQITGMGVPRGVTVIVGGGYHGKSTLLNAIQNGVYNKIEGDGREYIVTDSSAMKIVAENGRPIWNVNISNFLSGLPSKKPTTKFETENASGSTSQAASIMEALEAGVRTFLLDEDTSATNLLFRDLAMARIVDAEPIKPLCAYLQSLKEQGMSFMIVAGSTSAFFTSADNIIKMQSHVPVVVPKSQIDEAMRQSAASLPHLPFDLGVLNVPRPINRNFRLNQQRPRLSNGVVTSKTDEAVLLDINAQEQLSEPGQKSFIADCALFGATTLLRRPGIDNVKGLQKEIEKAYMLDQLDHLAYVKYSHVYPAYTEARSVDVMVALNHITTGGLFS